MKNINLIKEIQILFNTKFNEEVNNFSLLNNLNKDNKYIFKYDIKNDKIIFYKLHDRKSIEKDIKTINGNTLNLNINNGIYYIYNSATKYLKIPYKRNRLLNLLKVDFKNPVLSIQL